MKNRVAVYGTLKQGLANHHYLEKARFLGKDSVTNLVLYDLGPYPGAKLATSKGIEIEIYEVDSLTLAQLDQLEGVNRQNNEQGLYYRTQLKTRLGPAWVYIYNPSVNDRTPIRQGGWPLEKI
ncbi:Uncharacterized conserved protein YtfP, gamma-glutamylcyclotransferase (GGCT)/AIG2-like family [Marinospirillum celere]|uniref:Gamma-glutamylcyclotransferase family protein n=1 Tax=Marinospirillum celere TaxID=1122252 RepID=A0A1I1EKI8_9GAMM|nr:gamma-glutamylcyclotransferase family protein [Marinospirillum celere]SFB87625.1 Uncharacterized conserved protein YtfP, gamma-glutamylcyclotransferase (GGCT)/AIG2-like family [Marinospirillum celere]